MSFFTYKNFGAVFGYPKCCSGSFEIRAKTYPLPPAIEGPWIGTGFIPCDQCAVKILDIGMQSFVTKCIAPYRASSLPPFPEEGDSTLVFQLVSKGA